MVLLLGVAPGLEALLVVVIRVAFEAVAGRLYYGAQDVVCIVVVVIGVLVVAVDAGLVELRKPLRDLVEQVALPVQVGLGLLPPRVDLDAQGVLLEAGEEGAGVFEVLYPGKQSRTENEEGQRDRTVLALFLSYSLVRIRCSLSASACRMVCWRRASRRFRSVNESGLETLRRGVIMGAWLSLAMVGFLCPVLLRRLVGFRLDVVRVGGEGKSRSQESQSRRILLRFQGTRKFARLDVYVAVLLLPANGGVFGSAVCCYAVMDH